VLPQRSFKVSASDGVILDAVAQGDAQDPPLILLHGLSDSRLAFGPLLNALPSTLHAIAISQRGHGASSKPQSRTAYRAQCFADDIVAVLDAVGHHRCTLLGHSMGAWVALHCALLHPMRIEKLVLIGAFARFAGNPGVAELNNDVAKMGHSVDPAFVRAFQETASSADLPASFIDLVVSESMRVPAPVWQAIVSTFIAEDVPENLEAIRTPTLLLWGDRDPFVPKGDQDVLQRGIAASTLHTFEGLGHSPHWDRPNLVASMLLRALCG
jgi:non-heme chloroperoxidase